MIVLSFKITLIIQCLLTTWISYTYLIYNILGIDKFNIENCIIVRVELNIDWRVKIYFTSPFTKDN